MFQEECFVDKRLDTLVRLKHRCRETSVLDKMDKHFYVFASLDFRLDVFQLYLPNRFPSYVLIVRVIYNYVQDMQKVVRSLARSLQSDLL